MKSVFLGVAIGLLICIFVPQVPATIKGWSGL